MEDFNKIIDSINNAYTKYNADIILFPELSICSYPPEDLLFRSAFHDYMQAALNNIKDKTNGIYVLLGHPHKEANQIFNACSLIHNGKILQTYYKQNLPNYGVFDEKRYFTEGSTLGLFEINGVKAAISICEDIWVPEPIQNAAAAGAEIMFNINASPYHKTSSLYVRK